MDDYDEFSDNSIEITINEYQGKESHKVEKSIIRYLKNLGLKMNTNPMIKQIKYERSNNQIIDVITSKALSSQGNILKETETDYNEINNIFVIYDLILKKSIFQKNKETNQSLKIIESHMKVYIISFLINKYLRLFGKVSQAQRLLICSLQFSFFRIQKSNS